MRLLVLGAGPIGSLFAGRLALAGHEVELVARGARLAALQRDGLRLVDAVSAREERPGVKVVARGDPDAPYSFALVAVRAEQLPATFPLLSALRGARCLVTLVNQPDGGLEAARALGYDRLLLGFPGATGSVRADGAVVASVVPGWAQRTTFGEAAGGPSLRGQLFAGACRKAGFPAEVTTHMPAWLRTHAAFIGPAGVALALRAGGDVRALAEDRAAQALLLDGLREGLRELRAAGSRLEPGRFGWLLRAPRGLLLAALPRLLRSRALAASLGGHAAVSREEMRLLLGATRARAQQAGRACPATDALLALLDA